MAKAKSRFRKIVGALNRLLVLFIILWFFHYKLLNGAVESKSKLSFHFDKIEVRGAVTVYIEPGKRNRHVEYFADSSIIDTITVEVRNRTLYIDANNSYSLSRVIPLLRISALRVFPIEVVVSIEEIKEIRLLEQSSLSVRKVSGGEIKFFSSSTGFLHGSNLRCKKISVRHEGSGEVILKGREVMSLHAELYGSGSLRCEELFLEEASVRHYGTGQIMLAPQKWLDATINNSGDFYLLEQPEGRVIKNAGNGGSLIEQF